ncbi:VapE domain-containing protein [Burkholderia plantarii]|uniref:VapE domain-containing protein n=1 Tax=Burkholderia plantarii TaxID=41899 RepID=UPI0024138688|nr:VapE domain-containing protein [Burkholderia plantarii]
MAGPSGHFSGDDPGTERFRWDGAPLSDAAIEETRRRHEAAERQQAERDARQAQLAANRARTQWSRAAEQGASVYLERKQITAEGIRFDEDGTIFVPMYQYGDEPRMVGLQKITPQGAKRFNKGMQKKGAACLLGEIGTDDRVVLVAEGYATGRSIRMATGGAFAVSVCFDAGGILPVVQHLRAAYPDAHVLICADDDWKVEQRLRDWLVDEFAFAGDLAFDAPPIRIEAKNTWYRLAARRRVDDNGVAYVEAVYGNDVMPERRKRFENTGLKRAHEAAAAVGGASVVHPVFAARGDRKLTDFNDLHVEEGLHVVKAQIEAAILRVLAPADSEAGQPARLAVVEPIVDPLYQEAVEHVCTSRSAAPSKLQRALQIGYNRAARLIEAMERDGIVSALSDSGTRRVLRFTPSSAGAAGGEGDPENGAYTWEQRLRRTDRGALKPDLDNVIDILSNSTRWSGVLAYEQFSQKVRKLKAPPFEGGEAGEWVEHDDVLLTDWLGRTWSITPRRDVVCDAVEAVARRNSFHVVHDYLRGLTHDGKPRVRTWLIDYLGVDDTPYARAVGYKWLLGAMGRVMEPGCKMDNVLILEGPQDAGKSRCIKMLFSEEWSMEANINLNDPDAVEVLSGHWAIELAELDSLNKADSSAAKRWITTQADVYRRKYARRAVRVPRQFVVVGTVNHDAYLKDGTGNRRYWPVRIRPGIALAELNADRDQIWAEVYAMYLEWAAENADAGGGLPTPWQVLDSERAMFAGEQEARYEGDIYESLIEEFVEHRDRVTLNEIAFDCLKLEMQKVTKPEQRRIGEAMQAIGWARKRESTGARRWYYARSAETSLRRFAADRIGVPAGGDDAAL